MMISFALTFNNCLTTNYVDFTNSFFENRPMFSSKEGDSFLLDNLNKKKLWLKVKSHPEGILIQIPDNLGNKREIILESLVDETEMDSLNKKIIPQLQSKPRKNLFLKVLLPNSEIRYFHLIYPVHPNSEMVENRTVKVSHRVHGDSIFFCGLSAFSVSSVVKNSKALPYS